MKNLNIENMENIRKSLKINSFIKKKLNKIINFYTARID